MIKFRNKAVEETNEEIHGKYWGQNVNYSSPEIRKEYEDLLKVKMDGFEDMFS